MHGTTTRCAAGSCPTSTRSTVRRSRPSVSSRRPSAACSTWARARGCSPRWSPGRMPDAELVLLDGAGEMLAEARERLGDRASYVTADLGDPLPDGPWDAVVSALAIHHLDAAGKRDLFARVHDVLAPGGMFVNAEQVLGADARARRRLPRAPSRAGVRAGRERRRVGGHAGADVPRPVRHRRGPARLARGGRVHRRRLPLAFRALRRPRRAPRVVSDLWRLSLTDALAQGAAAEDVVASCRARIAVIEPELHAWVHLAGDAPVASGGLFDGLPVGVKDVIDTADMPTELGAAAHRGRRPSEDAACVALLRRAGATVLGKTVTTELASFSPGPTRNPHGHGHTPGGSSSGSAAAVAAGMVPVALGTQTAGSVVRPGDVLRGRGLRGDPRRAADARRAAAGARARHAGRLRARGRRSGARARGAARRRAWRRPAAPASTAARPVGGAGARARRCAPRWRTRPRRSSPRAPRSSGRTSGRSWRS